MLWIAASAAIAAATPATSGPAPAVVQARATVRIISGVRLKLDSPVNADAPPPRETTLTADGMVRRARLIEFE